MILLIVKALKCKTLGAELKLAHAHTMHRSDAYALYSIQVAFTLTTVYLLLTLEGNGRQLNLPRGNFND